MKKPRHARIVITVGYATGSAWLKGVHAQLQPGFIASVHALAVTANAEHTLHPPVHFVKGGNHPPMTFRWACAPSTLAIQESLHVIAITAVDHFIHVRLQIDRRRHAAVRAVAFGVRRRRHVFARVVGARPTNETQQFEPAAMAVMAC